MRQAFAHQAVLILPPDSDERAPGAAVTVALCGHWEHDPPCPLAPHHVRAERTGGELRVRILFAAEPGDESEVRRRIDLALAGQWPLPGDLTAAWQVMGSTPSEVTAAEQAHAGQLVAS
jgi:hypothetical protein